MNLNIQIQTAIENNKDFFPKLIDEKFSKIFNQFVYDYYSIKTDILLEDIFEIYNNIEYLNEYFGLPFENINKMKQLGKSFYCDDDSIYEIVFKSEAELFIDSVLIKSFNKILNC